MEVLPHQGFRLDAGHQEFTVHQRQAHVRHQLGNVLLALAQIVLDPVQNGNEYLLLGADVQLAVGDEVLDLEQVGKWSENLVLL